MDALAAVRQIAPATIGAVVGTTVDVGGDAAATQDANDNLSTHAPFVFGFVLAMAFLPPDARFVSPRNNFLDFTQANLLERRIADIIRLQAGEKGAWSIAQLPRVEILPQ